MKLQTSIPLRRDGTVKVTGLNDEIYLFKRDDEGEVSGDVDHGPTVAHLLAGGLFWPADEEDHSSALSLALKAAQAPAAGDGAPPAAPKPPAPASQPPRARPGPKPKTAAPAAVSPPGEVNTAPAQAPAAGDGDGAPPAGN